MYLLQPYISNYSPFLCRQSLKDISDILFPVEGQKPMQSQSVGNQCSATANLIYEMKFCKFTKLLS